MVATCPRIRDDLSDRAARRPFMSNVVHTSRIEIRKHVGAHRTARVEGFDEPFDFGIHGGIKDFYQKKYGTTMPAVEHPATLDYMIAAVAG
jgi:hypothetical protein